jgi:hypothetical protein
MNGYRRDDSKMTRQTFLTPASLVSRSMSNKLWLMEQKEEPQGPPTLPSMWLHQSDLNRAFPNACSVSYTSQISKYGFLLIYVGPIAWAMRHCWRTGKAALSYAQPHPQ